MNAHAHRLILATLVAVVATAAAGCGGGTIVPTPDLQVVAGDMAVPVDATAPPDLTPEETPDLLSPGDMATVTSGKFDARHFGAVIVQRSTVGKSAFSNVLATFYDNPAGNMVTIGTVGPCRVVTGVGNMAGQPTPVSAGTVTVKGGAALVTLQPDNQAMYASWTDPSSLFSGGEKLVVSASGATVPAFTAAYEAPSLVEFTAPKLDQDGGLSIDRTADLALEWTGGNFGVVELVLQDQAAGVLVSCDFPSLAGKGTVPRAALQKLGKGSSGSFAATGGGYEWDRIIQAGPYSVIVYVVAMGQWNGVMASGTFQATN